MNGLRRVSLVFTLFAVEAAVLGTASSQPLVRISPEQAVLTSAESCTLRIVVENVVNLGAFEFTLTFASDIVHARAAGAESFLGSTGRTVVPVGPHIDNVATPGQVTLGAATFGAAPGPTGNGTLAHVIFVAQTPGSSFVHFDKLLLADINGQQITCSAADGQIAVHPEDPCLVTNTLDSGSASLRNAVAYANMHPAPDTIRFDIPASDPSCDTTGVCRIYLTTGGLVLSDSGTVIDGFSQRGATPNTQGFGEAIDAVLKIVLDGQLASTPEPALWIYGSNNLIRGLAICGFSNGIAIWYSARGNRIVGNFIGTDHLGKQVLGSPQVGVSISLGSKRNTVGGVAPSARNLISGHQNFGIQIGPDGENRIQGNYIGTDLTGKASLANNIGIYVFNDSKRNLLGGTEEGAANLIAFNGCGVEVDGAWGQAVQNTVSRNSIHSNTRGIKLSNGGNRQLVAPTIFSASGTEVSGTAPPFCIIEVFSDSSGQDRHYEGSALSDASGNWAFVKPEGLAGPFVTATATDTLGNTSEFSLPQPTAAQHMVTRGNPSAFHLCAAFPNPFNPDVTLQYELPVAAFVSLKVFNVAGAAVRTLMAARHQPGTFTVRWDGKDGGGNMLPSGVYLFRLHIQQENGKVFAQSRKAVLSR